MRAKWLQGLLFVLGLLAQTLAFGQAFAADGAGAAPGGNTTPTLPMCAAIPGGATFNRIDIIILLADVVIIAVFVALVRPLALEIEWYNKKCEMFLEAKASKKTEKVWEAKRRDHD